MKAIINKPLLRGFFFQLIGTFLFSYAMGIASTQRVGGNITACCGLFVAIAFAGQITMAHFNPSISIAYRINKKYPSLAFYIMAQFIGGLLGSLVYLGLASKPFIPITDQRVPNALEYVKYILNQAIGTLFFSACVLVLTNKYLTHANKSWQIYLLIPVTFFLLRLLMDETILNPSIGLPYQIIGSIYEGDWTLFSYAWMLLVPTLVGAFLGGVFVKYLYEPLLLSIKFAKQLKQDK